jgi:hypothetical protein
MYLILIYFKFHPYPTVMPNVQLLSGQVHMVLYPQKTLHFPNPPLHSGLADTGFVLCSHWVGVLAYKKNHHKNCETKDSRKRLSTEHWSTCGMWQEDVCGFDTSLLILMDTWMKIVAATFQYWVPVVMWQKYMYSCLHVSCQEIWSCSSYTVQFSCLCFSTESNLKLVNSQFVA